MGIFEAIIQGVVQGLTEFLPVSSSGHLALSQHILGVQENNLFFDVMLHLGTLVAVLAVYYKLVIRLIVAFFSMIGEIFTGKFKWKNMNYDKRMVVMLIIGLLPLFCLFIPIPGTDMNVKDFAESLSNNSYIIVVGISLLVTSALLAIGIYMNKKNIEKHAQQKNSGDKNFRNRKSLNVVDSICIGFTQCVAAIFPGLSRSGSTLSIGLIRGVNKQVALDYSFVLGIPSILAAALLEFKDAMDAQSLNIDILPVVVGVIVSAIVGFLAIKLFKWLLATDKMSVFVWYTLIVGIVAIIIGIIEINTGANVFTGAIL